MSTSIIHFSISGLPQGEVTSSGKGHFLARDILELAGVDSTWLVYAGESPVDGSEQLDSLPTNDEDVVEFTLKPKIKDNADNVLR